MTFRKIKKFIHLFFGKNFFRTPPILIFFVTSKCNSKCPHCFYKNNLNYGKDLTLKEIAKISCSMGKIYQLELSGGEPFLRKDLTKIVKEFYQNNHLEELQIPTNSLLTDKISQTVGDILIQCPNIELNLNLSLDGSQKVHDKIRGVKGNFAKVLENYYNLSALQKKHPNLFINVTSTIIKNNIDNLFELVDLVAKKMPKVSHHYLGYQRGRFYTDKIDLPPIAKLKKLNQKIEKLYQKKNGLFYNFLIKKINQIKIATLLEKRQIVPCLAGRLVGVIYEDGKTANCEMLPPIGKTWLSPALIKQQQKIIEKRVCYCTHECFLPPSMVYGFKIFIH